MRSGMKVIRQAEIESRAALFADIGWAGALRPWSRRQAGHGGRLEVFGEAQNGSTAQQRPRRSWCAGPKAWRCRWQLLPSDPDDPIVAISARAKDWQCTRRLHPRAAARKADPDRWIELTWRETPHVLHVGLT